jgi:hypothetical protein
MEDFLLALLSGIFEILAEVFFQVAIEAIVGLITRSIRNLFSETSAVSPILAAMGYLLLGLFAGILSVLLFPHRLVPPSRIHGMSLVVSPVITGLIMSQVGALLRRKGKRAVPIESFVYGFTFALGVAIIRFAFLR